MNEVTRVHTTSSLPGQLGLSQLDIPIIVALGNEALAYYLTPKLMNPWDLQRLPARVT